MKKSPGITLIELIITIAITSIVGLGLVSLQYILGQNQIAVTRSYKSVDDANFILSSIEKEIRGARSSDNGAYYLHTANDQEIIFYSDIDLDGQTERIRYYLTGTDLIKEIIKPTGYPAVYDSANTVQKTISYKIRNGVIPIFYYYNEDWPNDTVNNPLASDNRLSATKTIKIYLRVNEEDIPEKDFVLESYSQIRSVKNNL